MTIMARHSSVFWILICMLLGCSSAEPPSGSDQQITPFTSSREATTLPPSSAEQAKKHAELGRELDRTRSHDLAVEEYTLAMGAVTAVARFSGELVSEKAASFDHTGVPFFVPHRMGKDAA